MEQAGSAAWPDFRAIFDAIPLPCLVVDGRFDIVAVNDAYLAVTLTQRSSMVGSNFLVVFPDNPDDPANPGNSNLRASLELVRRDLVVDIMPVQKYDIPLPDGTGFEERFWSPTNTPILHPDGTLAYVLHTARDITAAIRRATGSADAEAQGETVEHARQAAAASRQLKEVNAQLRQRTEELLVAQARADKASAAKSEFLSRMSHELRTPLNAIQGFAQLLEMDELTADQQDAVDHITKAGRHLIDLVNDILDLERVEAGRLPLKTEPLSLFAVVESVADLCAPLADRSGITLTVEPTAVSVWALADARRLTQTLLNLVGNAIKYTPSGGHVSLAVDARDDAAMVHVVDNGPGIRPDEIEKAFEPFERLAAEGTATEGAGLGLSLARLLTEAMDGSITIDSAPGHGSTFTVQLPRTEPATGDRGAVEAATGSDTMSTASAGHEAAQGRILYVEDNAMNVALIRQMAKRSDRWTLQIAPTVATALEFLAHETPDLVLLDLHLPDGNGLDVLQHLRGKASTDRTPVIALSADAMPSTRDTVLAAGADDFVTKPIDVQSLQETIDRFLRT